MSQRKSGTRRFGTNAVSGLNVSTAPHLIADHELVASTGWTRKDGAWSTAQDHVTVHTGSAISAMAVGRMGGQDHTVYVDGNGIYDTGSLVGTVTMGSEPRVVPIDRKFLILGASDGHNKVYDGDHLRDQGPWVSDMTGTKGSGGIQITGSPATYTVDAAGGGITKAANAKIFLTSVASLAVGMPIYLTGVLGMTEINNKVFIIQSIDTDGTPNWITINCDSSSFTAYTSGGTLYRQVCGLDGNYGFMATTIVELTDGTIIESAPMMLGRDIGQTGFSYTGDEAEIIALTPLKNVVFTVHILSWILSSVNQYNITGTIGTDYKPGVRLYRTKVDGTGDFYLEKQWKHGDTGLTYTTGAGYAYYTISHFIYLADNDLGALYTAGPFDHGAPPQSSLAAQVGQRVFLNDVDNPERVYVSGLDGSDYYAPTDWLLIPANVTALNRVRDRLVVGSAMRWYLIDMISGFPQVQELDTSVGVIYPDSISVNDQGLFFIRPNGAYHLDLSKTTKISRKAAVDGDLDEGQASIVTADVGVFVCDPQGASASLVANIRDGGWIWHQSRGVLQHTHFGRNSQGQILGALPTKIESLFLGSDYYGSMVGKVFSDGETWRTIRLLLDVECTGGASISYNVNTNYGAVFAGVATYTVSASAGRRIVEVPLARTVGETFQLTMSVTGNLTLYGYAIEVEQP